MPVTLTKEQEKSLADSLEVYNALHPRRLTMAQYLAQMLDEILKSHAKTTAAAREFFPNRVKAARNVH